MTEELIQYEIGAKQSLTGPRGQIRAENYPSRNVAVTCVSMDLGAGRRGVDMGPSAILLAGLIPEMNELGHTLISLEKLSIAHLESLKPGPNNARFIEVITDSCSTLRDYVEIDLDEGSFPLVLGGDHSIALGTVSGVARHFRKHEEKIGLLWVDAHGDMNTHETSPSGNIHGMPLAALLGYGHPDLLAVADNQPAVSPQNVCLIGVRDLDPEERDLILDLGVRVITMSELDERGIGACVKEALEIVTKGTAGFHLSFDLDAIDPDEAPGVGTPVPGGLTLREGHFICEKAADTKKLVSLEMVELNPVIDEKNQTGKLAVWLLTSAMGRRIL